MIVITGTGRSGTSFVSQIVRALGRDIGFGPAVFFVRRGGNSLCGGEDHEISTLNSRIMAGESVSTEEMQSIALRKDVVKDPFFCYTLDLWVRTGLIDHVIVCERSFEASARSALRTSLADPERDLESTVVKFKDRHGQLIQAIEKYAIPHTRIQFPRSIQEPGYTRSCLAEALGAIDLKTFQKAWKRVVDRTYQPTV